MRDTLAATISIVALFAVLLVAGLTFPDWKPYVAGEEPPVSVFIIGNVEGVQGLREVISPERVIASSPEAIVLREGRIIAASVEAVGGPLTAVGWVDRELDIVSVGPAEEAPARPASRTTASDFGGPAEDGPLSEAEAERFAQLSRQRSLSYLETHELLRYMERSGQI